MSKFIKMAATTAARSNIKIAPMAIVCKECDLIGDISIGSRTIIHPRAKIIAEAGPIIIGENNLIEEGVQIINRFPEGSPTDNQIPVMIIGNNNVFEVGSYVESLKIGDFNVVEVKASVGRQTELSSGCIVGAKCHLSTNECLEENTVIYGEECRRRVQQEHPFCCCYCCYPKCWDCVICVDFRGGGEWLFPLLHQDIGSL